ncbi:MAG: hypothetical protein RL660_1707 [Bacteroidota bacterium]
MKKSLGFLVAINLLLSSCSRTSSQHFEAFMGFAPTADVKNLNSHADEFGIDSSYWLAFECEDSTIDKIISKLQLRESATETEGLIGGLNTHPTSWWDTAFVSHSKPFYKEENRNLWYLWYDSLKKKAYFLTFDL